jgi:hypothetical protein
MTLLLITLAVGFVSCAIAHAAGVQPSPQRDEKGEQLYQVRLI